MYFDEIVHKRVSLTRGVLSSLLFNNITSQQQQITTYMYYVNHHKLIGKFKTIFYIIMVPSSQPALPQQEMVDNWIL